MDGYLIKIISRPLSKAISEKLSKVYLELPSECRHLYHTHRSPTPVHWDCRSVLEPKIRAPLGPFYSTGSVFIDYIPHIKNLWR